MKKKRSSKVVTTLLKRRKRKRGRPFVPGNEWRFPKGTSGNPNGRPKVLGESYAKLLSVEDPETGKLIAELVGEKMIEYAMAGDVSAARELRQATEGDIVHTPDAMQIVIDR